MYLRNACEQGCRTVKGSVSGEQVGGEGLALVLKPPGQIQPTRGADGCEEGCLGLRLEATSL